MAKQKPSLLGENGRKLQPKLRVIANGSTPVNAIRAEGCAALALPPDTLAQWLAPVRGAGAVPLSTRQLPKPPTIETLPALSGDVLVNVFVETVDVAEQSVTGPSQPVAQATARKGNLATATMSPAELKQVADDPIVSYIELGEQLAAPTPMISRERVNAPPLSLRRIGHAEKHHNGKGVLIGIIDVEGFDFAHPDFLDSQGKTRFIRIWDQGVGTRPPPSNAAPFDYGAELRQEHLNAAIAAAPGLGVPPHELEPQSQMAPESHGTHVASIAAGNRGICREAMIAAVLIALPADDLERRGSFYDSTRVAHAVDYLVELARTLGVPVAINVSLGTNGHAHDGSAAVSRWIDAALAVPGRGLCVAAGNAGQEVASFEGDIGFTMGRIHTSGRIAARELIGDIEWVVVGNGIVDLSENELELWFSPQDRFAVSLRPPGMDWIGPIEPRQFIENQQLADKTLISIYNELYHPANGANYISIYLSPYFSEGGVIGVRAGRWTVRLHGQEVRDGRYHGWIERDDPGRLGRIGALEAWRFPSFFTERSNVDQSSVSSLACGQRIIAVANLDLAAERINISSSQGPTREGRFKPDVAAPGTDIVAARGFAGPRDLWVSMTGTSMASPYVAGVMGLMLATQPKLTAAQMEGIVQRTAQPLPGTDFTWADTAGFGRIDPEACVIEASKVNAREDRTP